MGTVARAEQRKIMTAVKILGALEIVRNNNASKPQTFAAKWGVKEHDNSLFGITWLPSPECSREGATLSYFAFFRFADPMGYGRWLLLVAWVAFSHHSNHASHSARCESLNIRSCSILDSQYWNGEFQVVSGYFAGRIGFHESCGILDFESELFAADDFRLTSVFCAISNQKPELQSNAADEAST